MSTGGRFDEDPSFCFPLDVTSHPPFGGALAGAQAYGSGQKRLREAFCSEGVVAGVEAETARPASPKSPNAAWMSFA